MMKIMLTLLLKVVKLVTAVLADVVVVTTMISIIIRSFTLDIRCNKSNTNAKNATTAHITHINE